MNKKILIIDDSELVLAMAKDALDQAGYQVLTATNGIGDAAVLPVVLDITDTTPPAGPFGSLGSDSLNWTF